MLQAVNLGGVAGLKGEKGDRVSVKEEQGNTSTMCVCPCCKSNIGGMYEIIT